MTPTRTTHENTLSALQDAAAAELLQDVLSGEEYQNAYAVQELRLQVYGRGRPQSGYIVHAATCEFTSESGLAGEASLIEVFAAFEGTPLNTHDCVAHDSIVWDAWFRGIRQRASARELRAEVALLHAASQHLREERSLPRLLDVMEVLEDPCDPGGGEIPRALRCEVSEALREALGPLSAHEVTSLLTRSVAGSNQHSPLPIPVSTKLRHSSGQPWAVIAGNLSGMLLRHWAPSASARRGHTLLILAESEARELVAAMRASESSVLPACAVPEIAGDTAWGNDSGAHLLTLEAYAQAAEEPPWSVEGDQEALEAALALAAAALTP